MCIHKFNEYENGHKWAVQVRLKIVNNLIVYKLSQYRNNYHLIYQYYH